MRRRRRQTTVHTDTTDRWLVSYADFITLLFAFFVAMYAMSSVNEGKYRVLASSIVEAFNDPLQKDSNLFENEETQSPRDDAINPIEMEYIKQDSITDDTDNTLNEDGSVLSEQTIVSDKKDPAVTQDETANQVQRSAGDIADDIREEMSRLIDEGAVSVRQSDDWIEVEIKNNVLFPSGSARLHQDAIPILQSLSSIFIEFSNPIQIEGFTDNEPINTVAFPSNWELSAARAASVVHLMMKLGIRPKRMVAVGYGEHRPIADNDTEEGRQQNRRVVIIIPTADTSGHVIDTSTPTLPSGPSGQKRISVDMEQ